MNEVKAICPQESPRITEILKKEIDTLNDILETICNLEDVITGNVRITEQQNDPVSMKQNILNIHDRTLEIKERLYFLRELF